MHRNAENIQHLPETQARASGVRTLQYLDCPGPFVLKIEHFDLPEQSVLNVELQASIKKEWVSMYHLWRVIFQRSQAQASESSTLLVLSLSASSTRKHDELK